MTTLTGNTLIPISALLIVLSAGFSYGIMYQKVATLSTQVAGLETSVEELNTNVNRLIGIKSISSN